MKVIILLIFSGTAFAYNEHLQNPQTENLFKPAQSNYDSHGRFASITSVKTNRGLFFQPATFLPQFENKQNNLLEQVVNSQRNKRDAAGALHIMTNNAQPIHADVKPDGASEVTEKPCPKSKNLPSHIENGVVFQVTAPDDSFYELKSLRKSWPLPNKLELARSISRIITLTVLVISAIVEFFPLLKGLYYTIYSFIYL